jgi:hypothetical protein
MPTLAWACVCQCVDLNRGDEFLSTHSYLYFFGAQKPSSPLRRSTRQALVVPGLMEPAVRNARGVVSRGWSKTFFRREFLSSVCSQYRCVCAGAAANKLGTSAFHVSYPSALEGPRRVARGVSLVVTHIFGPRNSTVLDFSIVIEAGRADFKHPLPHGEFASFKKCRISRETAPLC